MSEIKSEVLPHKSFHIEFDGLKPENSIIQFDEDELVAGLTDQGLKPQEMKPLRVVKTAEDIGGTLADYDAKGGKVRFYYDSLVTEMQDIYRWFLRRSGQIEQGTKKMSAVDHIQKIFQSKYAPQNLPYLFVKGGPRRDFTPGDPQKVRSLLKRIADGEAYPGIQGDELKEKTSRVVVKLSEMSMRNELAWIASHEYEHRHNRSQKLLVRIASGVAPLLTGISISAAFRNQINVDNVLGPLLLSTLGMGAGSILGVAYDESKSYAAADKFKEKFARGIKIDRQLFEEQVVKPVRLGKKGL